MTYPDLFQHYRPLKGSDWLRTIPQDDLQAFVMIGFRESNYGRKGGKALLAKRGRQHLSNIGKRGALVSNLKRWIARRIQEETENL